MSNEGAINDLRGLAMFEHREEFIHTMDVEAINVAIEALEKQIPEKIERRYLEDPNKYPWGLLPEVPCHVKICPRCRWGIRSRQRYCSHCGQALDWQGVPEKAEDVYYPWDAPKGGGGVNKLEELLKAGYDIEFRWLENGVRIALTKNGLRSQCMITTYDMVYLINLDSALQSALEGLENTLKGQEERDGEQ